MKKKLIVSKKALPSYIEIETSSYCNRDCSWCPNGDISAPRSVKKMMPWSLFVSILKNLAEYDYQGNIGLTNYNEPLYNTRLYEEINLINTILPFAKIRLYTNGDKLNNKVLNQLVDLKVSVIRVTIYPKNDMKDIEPSKTSIYKFINRKDIDYLEWKTSDSRQGLVASCLINETTLIEITSPSIKKYSYRGGTAKTIILNQKRENPCYLTTHSATVDYTGKLKMCCCVFPESGIHDSYIIADLNKLSFIEGWLSPKLTNIRELHASSNWSETKICEMCIHHSPPKPKNFEIVLLGAKKK